MKTRFYFKISGCSTSEYAFLPNFQGVPDENAIFLKIYDF